MRKYLDTAPTPFFVSYEQISYYGFIFKDGPYRYEIRYFPLGERSEYGYCTSWKLVNGLYYEVSPYTGNKTWKQEELARALRWM